MTIRATDRFEVQRTAGGVLSLRIGILDTDSGFLQVLCRRLEESGHQHAMLGSPVGVDRLAAMRLHALLLDPALLGAYGWEYLERIGAGIGGMGVLVCTGRSTVAQRVRGLRLGADDWLSKPCHPEEVTARLESVVRRRRRAGRQEDAGPLEGGEVELRPGRHTATAAGQPLDLTPREFELLELLMTADGKVLTRGEIYERVWGYTIVRGDRSVDVFVRKLRLKLQRASPRWDYVHTHFGIGYRWAAQRAEDSIGAPGEELGVDALLEASAGLVELARP